MGVFNRRARTGIYVVPAIANRNAPTVAEITGGTPIHGIIRGLDGWTSDVDDLDNAVVGEEWNATIPGGETPAASSFTFRAGDNNADAGEAARATLARGTRTNIVICKRRRVPQIGDPVDIFEVEVKAPNDDYSADHVASTWRVGFSFPSAPVKHVAVV